MFTEFKNLKKAFSTVFGSKAKIEVEEKEICNCKCNDISDQDIVCAELMPIKMALIEYCRINVVECTELMNRHSHTKYINYRVKYFSEGINFEFEICLDRFNQFHTVACISCDTCLGTYIGHHSNDQYVDSPEIYFDKIFREKEGKVFQKLEAKVNDRIRQEKAKVICGMV